MPFSTQLVHGSGTSLLLRNECWKRFVKSGSQRPQLNKFEYRRASSPEEAARQLAGEPGARLLAGGTDLIPLMKDEIVSPVALVDISGWKEGCRIEETTEGLRIGALAPLSSLAAHEVVHLRYSALADVCRLSASPQLRSMGTLGGNLMQQTR